MDHQCGKNGPLSAERFMSLVKALSVAVLNGSYYAFESWRGQAILMARAGETFPSVLTC